MKIAMSKDAVEWQRQQGFHLCPDLRCSPAFMVRVEVELVDLTGLHIAPRVSHFQLVIAVERTIDN